MRCEDTHQLLWLSSVTTERESIVRSIYCQFQFRIGNDNRFALICHSAECNVCGSIAFVLPDISIIQTCK